jgi:hypothetical protein
MACLALRDGHAFPDDAASHEVRDLQADEVAPAEFAVDREIEEREIAEIAGKLEPDADGPDVFRQEWALLPEDAAPIPWRLWRDDGGEMDSGHDGSPSALPCPASNRSTRDRTTSAPSGTCVVSVADGSRKTSRVRFADVAVI